MKISKKHWKVVRSGMRGIPTKVFGELPGRGKVIAVMRDVIHSNMPGTMFKFCNEFLYAHRHLNPQITLLQKVKQSQSMKICKYA